MSSLLKFAHGVDWLNERIARVATLAVFLTAMISAGNAIIRYGFDIGSNAWLEVQWYMFAYIVMLGGPLVLKLNEHVRVDIIYGKLKGNKPVYVDLFGLVFFLLPVMFMLLWMSWPFFWNMLTSGETSQNAGGLTRWPAMLALPLGFTLMILQAFSEIIKRVSHLKGLITMDTHYEKPVQ